MEDGNWFLYAAMVVIAFISWVFQKIQEATAARRRGQEPEDENYEEERARFRDQYEEEGAPSDFGEEVVVRQEQPPPPAPAPGEETMRKLMEALGGTVFEAPKPPPPRDLPKEEAQPPKLEEPARPQLSAEEQAALERVKQQEEASRRRRRRGRRRSTGTLADLSVSELVRDPDGIRKAVILREILDKPRSERPWEFS